MPSRSRNSLPRQAPASGSQSRIPRSMLVTCPETMAYTSTTVLDDCPSSSFSLTSSTAGSRRYPDSRASYPDNDDYFLSNSPGMGFPTLAEVDSIYAGPMMSDPTYEFLREDALSGDDMDLNLASSHYTGHGQTQDLLHSNYVSVDGPFYSSSMIPNVYTPDLPWNSRLLTPPPEDYVQEVLPQHFLSAQNLQEHSCHSDQDFASYEASIISKTPSYSPSRHVMVPHRPIRCASERSGSSSEHNMSSNESRISKDEPLDKVKARSDPLYEAKPGKDGFFHCPMFGDPKCTHKPTKQKCIYNKYLDSHLRPYRCKFADRAECEDTRFSSNACLFRHEREAHGLHNHGVNPYLCKFLDCDRAKDGNGFPRKWNQRDHMKRVHDYVEDDAARGRAAGPDPAKRRKLPGAPTSAAMRRSFSSANAKAQAMASAALDSSYYGGSVSQASYDAPSVVYAGQLRAISSSHVSLDEVRYSSPAAISRTSRDSPPQARAYPA